MNRLQANFQDVEAAANFLSLYFSQPDYKGMTCAKCPCRALCTADSYCEEIIAGWLEGEAA